MQCSAALSREMRGLTTDWSRPPPSEKAGADIRGHIIHMIEFRATRQLQAFPVR